MSHPAKVLRAARKTTRRPGYSSSTKRSLLDSATELFTDHGYAGTSLDEVVAAARVTKGALYHHFPSKLALFESVFNHLQGEATRKIQKAIAESDDPWDRARIGLDAFLQVCREPHFRRICMQEAPVALGHERYREAERDAALGIVQSTVDDILEVLGGDGESNEAFGAIFYGAVTSAAEFVADAEDPDTASEQVQSAINAILAGMRMLPVIPEASVNAG